MERCIQSHLLRDLKKKIVLLSGPRQVGKTTLSKSLLPDFFYLNFDYAPDREVISKANWDRNTSLVIFDELHKMRRWKSFIKGIYDVEGTSPGLMVTGSARLNTYRLGGESLAGRHFLYRLHPFTLKETKHEISPTQALETLLQVGGFPEPFLNGSASFAKRWRRGHIDAILKQDLLDLEKVRDLKSIEILIELLKQRVGSTVALASLARDLQVSIHTVKHWLQILEDLFVIFPVRPFHRNISRSLLKESKYYFFDTGNVLDDPGARLENVVATALLAELNFLEDTTGIHGELCFLRDKEKREVDFLILIDQKPCWMIEVKLSDDQFSKHLFHFRRFLKGVSCLQLVHQLKRRKTQEGVNMVSVENFLTEINLVAP